MTRALVWEGVGKIPKKGLVKNFTFSTMAALLAGAPRFPSSVLGMAHALDLA